MMQTIDTRGRRRRVPHRRLLLAASALTALVALLATAGTASAGIDRFPVDGQAYVLKPVPYGTAPFGVPASGGVVVLQESFGLSPGSYPARMRWRAWQTGNIWWGQPAWRLVNEQTGKCLDDGALGSPVGGELVVQVPCNFGFGSAHQQFLIPGNLFGGTLIRPVLNRNLGVTAHLSPDTLVTLEPLSSAHNDEFQLLY